MTRLLVHTSFLAQVHMFLLLVVVFIISSQVVKRESNNATAFLGRNIGIALSWTAALSLVPWLLFSLIMARFNETI